MSITKAKLADRIHKALGVNTRFTEATPEQVIDTLNTVNDWMNSENGIGNRLGWVETPADEDPNPSEETGLPPWAVFGVTYKCAILVSIYFDKAPSQLVISSAANGMRTIEARTSSVLATRYPSTMPRGSGNKTPYGPNYYLYDDRIKTSNDFLQDEGGDPITSGGIEE